jgi:hypothetical protein
MIFYNFNDELLHLWVVENISLEGFLVNLLDECFRGSILGHVVVSELIV